MRDERGWRDMPVYVAGHIYCIDVPGDWYR